jgi:hypothetical protein
MTRLRGVSVAGQHPVDLVFGGEPVFGLVCEAGAAQLRSEIRGLADHLVTSCGIGWRAVGHGVFRINGHRNRVAPVVLVQVRLMCTGKFAARVEFRRILYDVGGDIDAQDSLRPIHIRDPLGRNHDVLARQPVVRFDDQVANCPSRRIEHEILDMAH